MRTCKTCGLSKDESEFRVTRGWVRRACLVCERAKAAKTKRETRAKDPEKARAYGRAYYYSHLEVRKAASKKWHKDNRDQVRGAERRARYGVSEEFVAAALEKQNNKCASCREPFIKTPVLDHNHKTGAFRGMLCSNCNAGLGMFSDSFSKLIRAADYIRLSEKAALVTIQ